MVSFQLPDVKPRPETIEVKGIETTVESILLEIERTFGVGRAVLYSECQSAPTCDARAAFMYSLRRLMSQRMEDVAASVERSRGAVTNGINRARALYQDNVTFKKKLDVVFSRFGEEV